MACGVVASRASVRRRNHIYPDKRSPCKVLKDKFLAGKRNRISSFLDRSLGPKRSQSIAKNKLKIDR